MMLLMPAIDRGVEGRCWMVIDWVSLAAHLLWPMHQGWEVALYVEPPRLIKENL